MTTTFTSPPEGTAVSESIQLETLLKRMQQDGVQRVKVGGVDIDGIVRGKYISLEKFESATAGGFGFCDVIFGWDSNDTLYDNGRYTGWHTGYPDTPARIDLSSYRIMPWEKNTAFFLVDFEGPAAAISPRQLLQRVVQQVQDAGYQPTMAAEYEFFFFRESSQSVRDKSYRNLVPFSPGMFGYSVLRTSAFSDFAHEVMDAMDTFDVPLEGFHTETGPGVYECAIRYDSALRSADKAVLFKTAVKALAARAGLLATFMAKWDDSLPGCGGHIHQSLTTDKGPVFHDGHGFSDTLRHFVAGQLELMPDLCALFCPTVNSYKRLVPGTWAPTSATWGIENRTTALRAIGGSPKSTRIEYRLPGADANPYLAMTAALASGLYGIQKRLEPPAAVKGSAYDAREAKPLPRSLEEATRRLADSQVARELLGESFIDHFVRTREWEVRHFQRSVTDAERARYFEII